MSEEQGWTWHTQRREGDRQRWYLRKRVLSPGGGRKFNFKRWSIAWRARGEYVIFMDPSGVNKPEDPDHFLAGPYPTLRVAKVAYLLLDARK